MTIKIGFQEFALFKDKKPFRIQGEFDIDDLGDDEFEVGEIRLILEPGNTLHEEIAERILEWQYDEIRDAANDYALPDIRHFDYK